MKCLTTGQSAFVLLLYCFMKAAETISVFSLLFLAVVSHPQKACWQHLVLSSLMLVIKAMCWQSRKSNERICSHRLRTISKFAFKKGLSKREVFVILVILLDKVNDKIRLFSDWTVFRLQLPVLFLPWGIVELLRLFWACSSNSTKSPLYNLIWCSCHNLWTILWAIFSSVLKPFLF